MILDTGTLFALIIALAGACVVMVFALMENMSLRKYINELLDKDELTAEEDK